MGAAEVMIVCIGFNPWLLENEHQQRDLVRGASLRRDVAPSRPPSSTRTVPTHESAFVGAGG